MPPNRHAVLSASSSHRWLHCNPSARLELEFEDRETEAAAEGTAAHALAEHKLRKALKMRSTRPVSKYDSDEMEMYTDGYLEFVLEAIEEARQDCPDPKVLIEQRLDFSCYVPDGFGTGDCLIVADKLLHIIDLKYGQGVLVNAEENPQMMLYALGALRIFDCLYDIETVSMTIYQPRRENVSTWVISVVLPSGRRLVYVKPKMGLNRFGNESVTYEGVGEQKKWLRLESYGPKFVENIVQATARDILAEATWPTEIHKWDHLHGLTYSVAVGTEAERKAALRQRVSVYIINRENVQWLVEESGLPFDYDMVVIDELSSFKSYQAKRFRTLLKVRPGIKRIVGLTGTPSSNGLMDLWAEFRILDMGKRLGRFITHYRNTFFRPDKRNGQVVFSYKPLPGAEEQIYDAISDITISMKAVDHLDMPECVHNDAIVTLSETERKAYVAMKQDLVISLKGEEIDAGNAAALANKLSQMANGAVYGEDKRVFQIHDRKLDMLEDLIEAANGKPVLVAYWFKHDLERISERLHKRHIPFSLLDDSDSIRRWNGGELPVALIHPASAGHGLNLQAGGSTLVWFGLTWSLELYQQTNARLWRQGQTADTVVIHHIIAKDTIDERIMTALRKKEKAQTALIDAVKANLEG